MQGAGGEAYGTDYNETVVDSEGTSQPISFDTVDQINVWISIDITTRDEDEAVTPNIDEVIREYVAEQAGERLIGIGANVKEFEIVGLVFESGVTGLVSVDVSLSILGFPPSPQVAVEIPISIRERADFDIGRVEVNP